MKNKKTYLLLSVLIFSSFTCAQQHSVTDQLAAFVNNIQVFNRFFPQEKVYLHFDNTGYYLGENIWFKAYVVNASNLQPESPSRVLYVELLNSRGIVLETKKLKIVDGQCHGDFFLTPFNYDYHAGFYEVRAYTKAMLNFGDEILFSRVFPVFNEPPDAGNYAKANIKDESPIRRLNMPNKRKTFPKTKSVNLDFYPEGGNLVTGVTSRMAFKATDERGMGIDVTGEVQNLSGETVTTFSSQHNGMGVFSFTPQENNNKIRIRYKEKNYTFDLPKALSEGYILEANNRMSNNLVLQIKKSSNAPAKPLGLSVTCRGQLVYFDCLQVDSQAIVIQIPKSELPVGVNQITLFDSKGEISAERLVFISSGNEEQYVIETKPDKTTYKPQERITIECSAEPETVFSISVRDAATTIDVPDAGNIRTNLLLSSDLKGCIENPSYYFLNNKNSQLALDLLMLVQGWRRYEWKQMAGLQPFIDNYHTEKGLEIKGKVHGKSKEVNIELALGNGSFLVDAVQTDSQGNFKTTIEDDLYGKYYILLNSPGLKNADRNIRLDKWFSPPPKPYFDYETSAGEIPTAEEDYMPEEIQTSIIRDTERKIDEKDKLYEIAEVAVTSRRGKDFIYNVEQDRERAIDEGKYYEENAREYMIEKNNGYLEKSDNPNEPDNVSLSARYRWGDFQFGLACMIDDKSSKMMTKKDLLESPLRPKNNVFVNVLGGPLTGFIDLEHIQKIVIQEWSKYLYHPTNERMTIPGYLYSHEKDAYFAYRRNAGYRVTSIEGYSGVKDFYTGRPEREDYLPGSTEHSRTLYWNPDVKTGEAGKALISFYNNAFCRKPEISAEGISKEGAPATNRK